jgi:hypothetical protein
MGSKNNQTVEEARDNGAYIEPEKEREVKTKQVTMDINRYLERSGMRKSLADLLRVIFKGQFATEAEWDRKSKEALSRRVR